MEDEPDFQNSHRNDSSTSIMTAAAGPMPLCSEPKHAAHPSRPSTRLAVGLAYHCTSPIPFGLGAPSSLSVHAQVRGQAGRLDCHVLAEFLVESQPMEHTPNHDLRQRPLLLPSIPAHVCTSKETSVGVYSNRSLALATRQQRLRVLLRAPE